VVADARRGGRIARSHRGCVYYSRGGRALVQLDIPRKPVSASACLPSCRSGLALTYLYPDRKAALMTTSPTQLKLPQSGALSWLEIDLSRLERNFLALRSLLCKSEIKNQKSEI